MKKTILLLSTLSVAAFCAEARTLTPAEALSRLSATTLRAPGLKSTTMQQPVYVEADSDSKLPMAYVFSGSDGGYMIVSADDVAAPLLAYGSDSAFDAETMPDNMRQWLQGYAKEIAYASEHISARPALTATFSPERDPIAPLLTTRWNQGEPYNDLCPTPTGSTIHCPTGCVATAMAQVMKYHNWPSAGRSSISYKSRDIDQTIECNFADYPLDWDNMIDDYNATTPGTAKQREAVATLMKVVGASVQMNYNLAASGSWSEYVGDALVKYFNYDASTIVRDRNHYPTTVWEEMVYDELAAGRPLYYAGANSSSAHAFVCDGYSSDGFYHFNWGWGGASDGYFRLSALDPSNQGIGGSTAGYSYLQYAAFGVQPPVEGSRPIYEFSRGRLEFDAAEVSKGSSVTMATGVYNRSHQPIPEGYGLTLAFRFHNLDTDANLYFVTGVQNYGKELADNTGWREVSCKIGSAMADGKYECDLVFRGSGGEWKAVRPQSPAAANRLYAVASGNNVTFTSQVADVKAENLAVSPIYFGKRFEVDFDLVNNDETPFYSGICAALIDNEGNIKAAGQVMTVEINGKSTNPIEYVAEISTKAEDYAPGEYQLAVVDYNAYCAGETLLYSKPMAVAVKETPAEETKLTLNSWVVVKPTAIIADDIHVKFSVKCQTGVYTAPLSVAFYEKNDDGTAGTFIGLRDCKYAVIEKGQTLVEEYVVSFPNLEVGKSYVVSPCFYDGNRSMLFGGNTNKIITVASLSGLGEVEAAEPVSRRYFDLTGREIANPAAGSLVIESAVDCNGNITVTKHIFQ